jgi:hypothetical protein
MYIGFIHTEKGEVRRSTLESSQRLGQATRENLVTSDVASMLTAVRKFSLKPIIHRLVEHRSLNPTSLLPPQGMFKILGEAAAIPLSGGMNRSLSSACTVGDRKSRTKQGSHHRGSFLSL